MAPRFLILAAAAFTPAITSAQSLPSLSGDPEAVQRMERMLESMGGRQAWASARSLFLHYRQLSSGRRPGEGEQRAWRDLGEPRQRLEYLRTDPSGTLQAWAGGFDPEGGWQRRDGAVTPQPAAEHKDDVQFWPREFYTQFRRIAAGDQGLRYRFTPPNRIDVFNPDGLPIGWWDIDAAGNLLRWGATTTDGVLLSYVYGPYRKYGAIAFPAWGTASDGTYRFEYRDVAISPKPLPAEVLRDRATAPRRDLRLP